MNSSLQPRLAADVVLHVGPGHALPLQSLFCWLLAIVLACCIAPAQAQATEAPAPATGARQAILLEITGAIGPATTEYLERGLEQATAQNAAVVILRIDTPGGLVSSLRDINRHILASAIPIIAFVAPGGAQAASAGTYIVYASHLAAMAPATNLGAATPVQMGGAPSGEPASPGTDAGKGNDDSAAQRADPRDSKAENDAVAYIRSLADLQGRNADWAESAVREAASLPAQQALEQGVVEILAQDVGELLQKAHGRTVNLQGKSVTLATQDLAVTTVEPNWRSRLLATITNPNLAYILLLLGIYGIVFELMSPGAIFPGSLGAVALVTALFALNMLPINYAGIGLLVLGIGMMIAEAFVSSFGILGIGGLLIFGVGSVFLFDTGIPGFALSPTVIVVAGLASLGLMVLMATAAVRAHRRRVVSGDATLVDTVGKVLQWSGNRGLVQIHGETWQAVSEHPLSPRTSVRIIRRDGLVLTVVPQHDTTQGD